MSPSFSHYSRREIFQIEQSQNPQAMLFILASLTFTYLKYVPETAGGAVTANGRVWKRVFFLHIISERPDWGSGKETDSEII